MSRAARESDLSDHLRCYLEAWHRGDSELIAGLYTEDAVMEDPTLGTPRVGRAGIQLYFSDLFEGLEDPKHEVLDFATRGERVWFEWTFSSGGVAVPWVQHRGVSIQTLRDGLIVHDHAYWQP